MTTDRDKARRELSEGMAALSLTAMPALKVLCADDAYSINLARYVIQSWQSHLTLYFTRIRCPPTSCAPASRWEIIR